MAEAPRDQNHVTAILGTSSDDGETTIPVHVNPVNNGILADDDTTGTDKSDGIADRDQNHVTTLMGVSSVDGVTPVEIYVDLSNQLLIDSS